MGESLLSLACRKKKRDINISIMKALNIIDKNNNYIIKKNQAESFCNSLRNHVNN
jgi:hypothetical protein